MKQDKPAQAHPEGKKERKEGREKQRKK